MEILQQLVRILLNLLMIPEPVVMSITGYALLSNATVDVDIQIARAAFEESCQAFDSVVEIFEEATKRGVKV